MIAFNQENSLAKRQIKMVIVGIVWLCLHIACANKIAPNGGDKDETPPKVLGMNPPNASTNFDKEEIYLAFDEYVVIKNQKEKILISPLMEEEPEIKPRGKGVLITIKSPLEENTTYVINFGSTIRDLNEGNPIENFQYAFSTGKYIDSLAVRGTVSIAEDGKPAKQVIVGLYNTNSDTLFTTTQPSYVTQTDEEGHFQLNYLAEEEYQLIALEDQNSNYFYDQAAENIAFHSEFIEVNDSIKNYDLVLFNEDKQTVKVKEKAHKEYGNIKIQLNKGIDTVLVSVADTIVRPENLKMFHPKGSNQLDIWYTNIQEQHLNFVIATDTGGIDTVRFTKAAKKETLKDLKLGVNTKRGRGGVSTLDLGKTLAININTPISRVLREKMIILEDSIPLSNAGNYWQKSVADFRQYEVNYSWKAGKTYQVILPDSTLFDMFDRSIDSTGFKFALGETRNYGVLHLKFENQATDTDYLIELLKGNKVEQAFLLTKNKVDIPYLNPSKYSVRITIDRDKNGKWTTGNYEAKRQPEKIIITEPIEVKANWDSDLVIDLKQ